MTESVSPGSFLSSALRTDAPDFLDLPWDLPLAEWSGRSWRLVDLPAGASRHPVVFAAYGERVYALKELPDDLAEREYDLLRGMEDLRLPAVTPVGHIRTRTAAGEASVLVTRYLDRALPYHLLFQRRSLSRYRDHLLDAMASLLVQLHLAGAYWGDCSLYNTLFRRDAGALQAYLVDAETSELRDALSDALREQDVDIMEENVCGALLDLQAARALSADYDVLATGVYLRERYAELWKEITREEVVPADQRYRIQERVRALNALGFSVDQVELSADEGGRQLRLRALVTDRNFHRHLLHSLTGIDAEEMQARRIVTEIRELKVGLSDARNRSVPMSVAAFHWQTELFEPLTERLLEHPTDGLDPVELYCELLEHKWYLSERAQRDVGHQAALENYLERREG